MVELFYTTLARLSQTLVQIGLPACTGDNPRNKRAGGQTMVELFYTTLISVDLAQYEILRAKVWFKHILFRSINRNSTLYTFK